MKNLLVTLADENYIDQAKQLFSSAYWNGRWEGDCMLLAHEIPEEKLKWFRNKGILIKKCTPLYDKNVGTFPPVTLDKFYLFTPEFKRWDTVIFLDADIIVRFPLVNLTGINGFAAVKDFPNKLKYQFVTDKKYKNAIKLKQNYNLDNYSFNTGVFTFSTNIIKKDTFDKLRELFEVYKNLVMWGEQGFINLLFYKRWVQLPQLYNINIYQATGCYLFNKKKIRGVLHFIGAKKPWNLKNPFNREWRYNLKRAELIDLKKRISAKEVWDKEKIKTYSKYIRIKQIVYSPIRIVDKLVGQVGILLKKIF